jgi:orotidine-5'-phosphate decarboxylase
LRENFVHRLNASWEKSGSMLCVGLDPLLSKIPPIFQKDRRPFFAFNKAIIEATNELVCAYKPQVAYYSAEGREAELEATIDYIRENFPHIPVILDSKRCDIGATASQYAREAFDRYRADAVTVSPFLGTDSLSPFLERADRGIIVLCRTSNPGAQDIQDLEIRLKDGKGVRIYEYIAKMAQSRWNENGNLALVVGGTHPDAIANVRRQAKDLPLLIPGIGVQGGDVGFCIQAGMDSHGKGLIINSSRAIIYAGSGSEFSVAVGDAAKNLRDAINRFR